MKRFLSLVAMMLLCVWAFAGNISQQQAMQIAKNFMNQRSGVQHRMKAVQMNRQLQQVPSTGRDAWYLFNVGENNGYVLVAGNDDVEPILGYSDNGRIDADNMPEGLSALLKRYTRELSIDNNSNSSTASLQKTLSMKAATRSAISPLLHSRWNQGAPYSNMVPTYDDDGNERHYPTGCVATTMAQVMYYYKYAKMSEPLPAYTTQSLYIDMPELPMTAFDWDNMLPQYVGNESSEQQDAVAKLMLYAGQSLEMDYNRGGSGASGAINYPLVKYFGYDESARYVSSCDYTVEGWIDLIYSELEAGRPVAYCGHTFDVGHSFVCDGYQGDDYFHINWGWGGVSDGYFRLYVLNPDDLGIGGGTSSDGYSMSCGAAIGLQPSTGKHALSTEDIQFWGYYFNYTNMDRRQSVEEPFTHIQATSMIYNITDGPGTFDFVMGYYDENHKVQLVSNIVEDCELNSYECITPDFNLNFGANMTGTYHILGFYRRSGSKVWIPSVANTMDYLIAELTETDLVLNRVMSDIQVASLTADGYMIEGLPLEVTATFTNTGNADGKGDVYLYDNGELVGGGGVAVAVDGTQDLKLHYVPQNAGEHKLELSTRYEYDSDEVIASTTITLAELPDEEPNLETAFSLENSDYEKSSFTGNDFKGEWTVTNNGLETFYGNLYIINFGVFDDENWTYNQNSKFVAIESGKSVTVPFLFENATPEAYGYYSQLYAFPAAGGQQEIGWTGYFSNVKQTDDISLTTVPDSFAKAKNVRIYDASGRFITNDSLSKLPAGLYIYHMDGKVKKVVVK